MRSATSRTERERRGSRTGMLALPVIIAAVPLNNSSALPRLTLRPLCFSLISMISLLLSTTASMFRSRRALVLENLALRHQLQVLQRSGKRARFRPLDRGFWSSSPACGRNGGAYSSS